MRQFSLSPSYCLKTFELANSIANSGDLWSRCAGRVSLQCIDRRPGRVGRPREARAASGLGPASARRGPADPLPAAASSIAPSRRPHSTPRHVSPRRAQLSRTGALCHADYLLLCIPECALADVNYLHGGGAVWLAVALRPNHPPY